MTILHAEHHHGSLHTSSISVGPHAFLSFNLNTFWRYDYSQNWFNAQHVLDYSICLIQMFTSNALSECWQNDGFESEINDVCGDRNWSFGCK